MHIFCLQFENFFKGGRIVCLVEKTFRLHSLGVENIYEFLKAEI